jgi:hypothetical protein
LLLALRCVNPAVPDPQTKGGSGLFTERHWTGRRAIPPNDLTAAALDLFPEPDLREESGPGL